MSIRGPSSGEALVLRNALKACGEALVARLMWIVCFDGQYADFTSFSLGRARIERI